MEHQRNQIVNGNCIDVLKAVPASSIDLILTDPPYICRYRDRQGRKIVNDDNAGWLIQSSLEMYRVLKPGSFCISFYGWAKADQFLLAWRNAGFRPCGHIVFRKGYASSSRFLRYEHENAYLLAKGVVSPPARPIGDVIDFAYTGNRLHPTQKPVSALRPLIESLTKPGDLVLDPFCGSGSTLIAARELGRDYLGIELDRAHFAAATNRLRREGREPVT
jgi:site-specific DNA-methyltransferase (adenine-specific)